MARSTLDHISRHVHTYRMENDYLYRCVVKVAVPDTDLERIDYIRVYMPTLPTRLLAQIALTVGVERVEEAIIEVFGPEEGADLMRKIRESATEQIAAVAEAIKYNLAERVRARYWTLYQLHWKHAVIEDSMWSCPIEEAAVKHLPGQDEQEDLNFIQQVLPHLNSEELVFSIVGGPKSAGYATWHAVCVSIFGRLRLREILEGIAESDSLWLDEVQQYAEGII